MREKTHAVTQSCLTNELQLGQKSDFFYKQRVRVTHTYELDRSEEGIA
ncbi:MULTISPECIES: hypothetical protein [unclassified Paenibacillus]|nr:hypothetical protein [Paenibacillus sp. FSL A5-0031]